MTAEAAPAPSSAQAPAAGRTGWLFGPAPDLLLGAGAGYLLSVPVLVALSATTGFDAWPTAVFLLLSLLISGPHYGATLLRVYEHRDDRRRYALFAVWATLAIAALFVAGLHSAWLGSALVSLYATWSPWHFSGQNYGVALMFLRRHGVAVAPRAKRWFYASFVLAFALAFLVMHGQRSVLSNATVPIGSQSSFQFFSLGIPLEWLRLLVPATAAAYAGSLVGAFALLRRAAPWRDLGPAASLVVAQSLWFALPAALPRLIGQPLHGLAFTIVWISAAHGLQYLWVSFFYARGAEQGLRLRAYLIRTLMAGSTVTIFPALLFAPGVLGTVPWDNGLAILLISVVNLHHFVLDGAIWKLRDGRVARRLLRDASRGAVETGRTARAIPGFRPAMAALGCLSLAVASMDGWEREYSINHSGGDIDRILGSADRLAWIGRDAAPLRTQIAQKLAVAGRFDESAAQYARSLALFPTAGAWLGLGRLHASRSRWEQASAAFDEAVRLEPDDPVALANAGTAQLELGRRELARASLERAWTLAPGNPEIRRELQRLAASQR